MLNERQIALRKGGNYTNLDDFFDRRKVVPHPFKESASKAVSAQNYMLVDTGELDFANLSVDKTSTYNGGLFVAELPAGTVGSGSTEDETDDIGNILNMVKLRDATTHDPITYDDAGEQREIFGLFQCDNGLADGAAITDDPSWNVQISFVYIASNGTVTLTPVTATVEFQQNELLLERYIPTIKLEGGAESTDVVSNPLKSEQGEYVVTTAFPGSDVIDLSDGDGATGLSTFTGDQIALGASGAEFKDNHLLQVMLNGVEQRKQTEVIWDSSSTMHFINPLDIGDYFEIRLLKN